MVKRGAKTRGTGGEGGGEGGEQKWEKLRRKVAAELLPQRRASRHNNLSQAELTLAELVSLCTYRSTHTPSGSTSGGFDKEQPPTVLLLFLKAFSTSWQAAGLAATPSCHYTDYHPCQSHAPATTPQGRHGWPISKGGQTSHRGGNVKNREESGRYSAGERSLAHKKRSKCVFSLIHTVYAGRK